MSRQRNREEEEEEELEGVEESGPLPVQKLEVCARTFPRFLRMH